MDRTFCSSPECTNECGRKLTPELLERAREWWGDDHPPISMSNFCDKPLTNGKNYD